MARRLSRYVAFLRGVNVGGHRVKMDHLREIFEALDLRDVSTFIASGNVIFSTDADDLIALSEAIERHLVQRLGYEVATFLRSSAQIETIAAQAERTEREGEWEAQSVYVILLKKPAGRELRAAFSDLESDTDAFEFADTEIYWRIRGKISESPLFGKALDGALRGTPTTSRNVNTLRRLVPKTRDPTTDDAPRKESR